MGVGFDSSWVCLVNLQGKLPRRHLNYKQPHSFNASTDCTSSSHWMSSNPTTLKKKNWETELFKYNMLVYSPQDPLNGDCWREFVYEGLMWFIKHFITLQHWTNSITISSQSNSWETVLYNEMSRSLGQVLNWYLAKWRGNIYNDKVTSFNKGKTCSNHGMKHDQLFGQSQPALHNAPMGNSEQRKVICDESLVKRSIQNISWPDCLHWFEPGCSGDIWQRPENRTSDEILCWKATLTMI